MRPRRAGLATVVIMLTHNRPLREIDLRGAYGPRTSCDALNSRRPNLRVRYAF